MATSISRRARIPGWKQSSCRIRRTRTTIGTSGSRRSATRPMPPLASSTATTGSSEIVNNYAQISFNFGPTLLSWLKEQAPDLYQTHHRRRPREPRAILGPRFGHRPGLQPHDHAAGERRDKRTQIIWGIDDFGTVSAATGRHVAAGNRGRSRNARNPGRTRIRFTILAPHQAHRVREIGERDWIDVTGGRIDPTRRIPLQPRPRAEPSICSSTTARSRGPSPSSVC